jgi:hypothetical protein
MKRARPRGEHTISASSLRASELQAALDPGATLIVV